MNQYPKRGNSVRRLLSQESAGRKRPITGYDKLEIRTDSPRAAAITRAAGPERRRTFLVKLLSRHPELVEIMATPPAEEPRKLYRIRAEKPVLKREGAIQLSLLLTPELVRAIKVLAQRTRRSYGDVIFDWLLKQPEIVPFWEDEQRKVVQQAERQEAR